MEPVETIHIAAKDLICPICYQKYGLQNFQPISLNCGHNLCSHCLKKVKTCPVCRAKILDRSSYSKNVLISSILEHKNKTRECKTHNRPIEFFCKSHKQLLCVDCGIEGKHFSHDFVKCREVDNRAEKIKGLMKKIETKEEESKNQFKTFIEKEKKSLKRKVDEILDEYIEPIIQVKKRLRREVDAFFLKQTGSYEKEGVRENMLKWKKENESLVAKWEATGEGEVAAQIVSKETDEIENRIIKYEKQTEDLESKTGEKIETMLKDMKSRFGGLKSQWKKVKPKFNEVLDASKLEIDPRLEREYLAEYLVDKGIVAFWVETNGEFTLELRANIKELRQKDLEDKFFECMLEKVKLNCFQLDISHFEVVCRALEKVINLLELSVILQNVTDQEVLMFGECIHRIKTLTKLSVAILSERVTQKHFKNLWAAVSNLRKLKTLNLTLEGCDQLGNSETESMMPIGKMKALKELVIKLNDCDSISDENFEEFVKSLEGLTHLTKFGIAVCECKKLSYKLFDSLCKTLTLFTRLEELSLIFEDFYEPSNPLMLAQLGTAISSLAKLKKLELSFSDNICLPSAVIKKVLSKFTPQLKGLTELSLDFTRCREISNQILEGIGASVAQLASLTHFTFKINMCDISEKGIAGLAGHLSSLNSLRFLRLDCRNCFGMEPNARQKALEYFSKIAEKELLFSEPRQEPILGRNNQNNILGQNSSIIDGTNLWSPSDGSDYHESEMFELNHEYLDNYDDDNDDDDDDEDDEDLDDFDNYYYQYGTSDQDSSDTGSLQNLNMRFH